MAEADTLTYEAATAGFGLADEPYGDDDGSWWVIADQDSDQRGGPGVAP